MRKFYSQHLIINSNLFLFCFKFNYGFIRYGNDGEILIMGNQVLKLVQGTFKQF